MVLGVYGTRTVYASIPYHDSRLDTNFQRGHHPARANPNNSRDGLEKENGVVYVIVTANKNLKTEHTLMKTVCHKELSLGSLFNKEIIACFDGGRMTSDGGGLLLREIDERYRVTAAVAAALHDSRDPERTVHEVSMLVKQRIFSIALGYEDANDADTAMFFVALAAFNNARNGHIAHLKQ